MSNWSGSYIDMPMDIELKGQVRVFDLAVQLHNGMPRHPHHPPFSFAMANFMEELASRMAFQQLLKCSVWVHMWELT